MSSVHWYMTALCAAKTRPDGLLETYSSAKLFMASSKSEAIGKAYECLVDLCSIKKGWGNHQVQACQIDPQDLLDELKEAQSS